MSTRILSGLAVLVSALLFSAAPAWSQAKVAGLVTDSAGKKMPGVEIALLNKTTQEAIPGMTTTTNAQGRYLIVNVGDGHHMMRVSREDFSQSETFTFTVQHDARHPGATFTVNVQLKMSTTRPKN
jgi:hypothetical protein